MRCKALLIPMMQEIRVSSSRLRNADSGFSFSLSMFDRDLSRSSAAWLMDSFQLSPMTNKPISAPLRSSDRVAGSRRSAVARVRYPGTSDTTAGDAIGTPLILGRIVSQRTTFVFHRNCPNCPLSSTDLPDLARTVREREPTERVAFLRRTEFEIQRDCLFIPNPPGVRIRQRRGDPDSHRLGRSRLLQGDPLLPRSHFPRSHSGSQMRPWVNACSS